MSEFAAFVGWDWADQEHELRLREAGSDGVEEVTLGSSPEALHGWVALMQQRYQGRPVAICIETSRGPVIWALMAYAHIVLFPVNPKSVASFRETFYPSGKKDDPVDAEVQLELVYKHHDKLRRLNPADAATRSLAILSEYRRKLVQGMVRETNRLRTNLKSYFPQALELTGELGTPMACDFLARWPSLSSLQKARRSTIEDFYRKHGSRSEDRISARMELLGEAIPLTDDEAVVSCGILVTQAQVRLIDALRKSISDLDDQLKALYDNHIEHDLIDSFPGLGLVLGSRMVAILGSDRDRFETRESLQLLTGVAPITKRTGGKNGPVTVQRRLRRSKFIHQTIVEWAGQTVQRSSWAKAFYDEQIAKGKGHWSVLRGLGFKWLRVLFRCWETRQKYDEATYVEALRKHGSSLASKLTAA
jgi:transposase